MDWVVLLTSTSQLALEAVAWFCWVAVYCRQRVRCDLPSSKVGGVKTLGPPHLLSMTEELFLPRRCTCLTSLFPFQSRGVGRLPTISLPAIHPFERFVAKLRLPISSQPSSERKTRWMATIERSLFGQHLTTHRHTHAERIHTVKHTTRSTKRVESRKVKARTMAGMQGRHAESSYAAMPLLLSLHSSTAPLPTQETGQTMSPEGQPRASKERAKLSHRSCLHSVRRQHR